MSSNLKTIKIIIPGIKYDINKPLLSRLNNIITGDTFYFDNSKFYDENTEFFDTEKAYIKAKEEISNINFNEYNEVIFICKSIGTYIGARIRKELNLKRSKMICLTPLDKTIPYLEQTDYIVYGTSDKYLLEEGRNKLLYKYVNLSIINNANHRLEVDNELVNEKVLKQVELEALNYLDSSSYME